MRSTHQPHLQRGIVLSCPNWYFKCRKKRPHLQAMHCERYRETLPTNWLHPHRWWLVGTLRALVGISMGKDSFCCRNNEPKHASKLCENYSRDKENQRILDISPTVTWPDPCRIFTIWGDWLCCSLFSVIYTFTVVDTPVVNNEVRVCTSNRCKPKVVLCSWVFDRFSQVHSSCYELKKLSSFNYFVCNGRPIRRKLKVGVP